MLDVFPLGGLNLTPTNVVYRNNLTDNSQQALVVRHNVTSRDSYSYGNDIVSWDNGTMGNYWSDYTTKYPSAIQVGSSGIGNTPYEIDAENMDKYPLMQPYIASSITLPMPAAAPTTSPTVSPTPSPEPTIQPTATPTQEQPEPTPTPTPDQQFKAKSFPTFLIATFSAVIIAVLVIGFLIYFKKHKRN